MSNVSKGQIQLPGEFRPGEPIRAGEMDKLRKAIAFVMKDMIGSGRGITVTQSAGKYLISARKQRGGAKAPTHPFQIVPFVESETQKARIRYGLVNNFVPTINAVQLDPVLEDGPSFEITMTEGNRVIYMRVTIDSDLRLISAEIEEGDTLPDNTTTEGYVQIGLIVIADEAIASIIQGVKSNLTYAYGGVTDHLFFYGDN